MNAFLPNKIEDFKIFESGFEKMLTRGQNFACIHAYTMTFLNLVSDDLE